MDHVDANQDTKEMTVQYTMTMQIHVHRFVSRSMVAVIIQIEVVQSV